MLTPQNFLMSQLPVSMQVTTPSAMNFTGFQPGLDLMPDGETALNVAGPTAPVPINAADPVDPLNEKDPKFQDAGNKFLDMFTDDDFRRKLMKEKGEMTRNQMRDAYMMGTLQDMPREAKQHYQEMGDIYGQAGANLANIIGTARVPQAQIDARAPGAVAPRNYFR